MEIKEILSSPEGRCLELKEEFNDNALKTISAFANTAGGLLVIGISNDRVIKGINISDSILEKISNTIVDNLGISPEIEILKEDGERVIVIKVQKSRIPISFKGRYYKRVGNTTREMNSEELRAFFQRTIEWDYLTDDYSFDEIDEDTVRYFLKRAIASGRLRVFSGEESLEEVFERLLLSKNGKITNGALMLFGKNPQKYFLNATVRVVRMKDDITIIGDRIIDGNLFKQLEKAEEAIKSFINVRYEITGELQRKEIWDYPLVAIREVLVNALVHRDYFKWNVETQIKVYDDFIYFFNVGGLPQDLPFEKLFEPHPSYPRNPLIAYIFYLSGIIERVGSGIQRILDSFKKAGLPEPEFDANEHSFTVIFRKDIYNEENLRKLGLNERQIKAVMYVKEKGRITNREYQEINNCSRNTATNDLKDLVREGILKESGKKGAGAYYIIAS